MCSKQFVFNKIPQTVVYRTTLVIMLWILLGTPRPWDLLNMPKWVYWDRKMNPTGAELIITCFPCEIAKCVDKLEAKIMFYFNNVVLLIYPVTSACFPNNALTHDLQMSI